MNNILFEGIYSATFSIYDKNLNVMKNSVEKLIHYNKKNGVQGFYVGGKTGECTVLPNRTRMQMLKCVKESENKPKGYEDMKKLLLGELLITI